MQGAQRITAAGTAALLLSALIAGSVAGVTRSNGPTVNAGWKDGPVAISASASLSQVAALSLPSGTWVAWAKLFVTNDNGGTTFRGVTCKLGSQTASGFVGQSGTVWVGTGDSVLPGSQPMSLSATAKFGTAGGNVALKCASPSGGGTSARWIKIMAMAAGSLTSVDISSGGKTTSGTGQPKFVVATRTGSVTLPRDVNKKVGGVSLGRGSWYVRASFTLEEDLYENFRCRLKLGTRVVDVEDIYPDQGAVVVTLDGAATSSTKLPVAIQCKGTEELGYGHPYVHDLTITALKAGTLVTYDRSGTARSHGSGMPRIWFKTFSDRNVGGSQWVQLAQLTVASGKWMAFANMAADVNDGLACQLQALPDYDETDQLVWGALGLPFEVVHQFADNGTVRLQCMALNASAGPSALRGIHIAAFKLGSLRNVPLD